MTAVVGAPPKFLCSAACPFAGANLSAPREGCVAYSSLCTALTYYLLIHETKKWANHDPHS